MNRRGAWVVVVSLGPIQADSTVPDGFLGNLPVFLLNRFGADGRVGFDEPDEECGDARAFHG